MVNVSVSGPTIDVWGAVDTLHKCHFIDVPDIPARAFVDNKAARTLILMITLTLTPHRNIRG